MVTPTPKPGPYAAQFPPGTPVLIQQEIGFRGRPQFSRIAGTVEAWDKLPTGSWHAHGKNDRLWLERVKLRKHDGEVTLIVIDDMTHIAKLEAKKADAAD